MSGWTGLDFAAFDPDQEVRHIESEAMRTALENVTTRGDPTRRWTVREVAEFVAIGGVAPVLVGSAAEVADAVEDWVDRTGVDGLNLSSVVFPETFERIAALLVPELQRRGRVKREYRQGTLREKLFGRARVADTHPASTYRVG
jgi:alkanesulfonate monooxygenase